ncbi:MAG TPA: fumarylacetoacetate hydrolase family protein [Chloroflexota bacterium]|jgi:fumarylacetoacetate (FAA) hydrolase
MKLLTYDTGTGPRAGVLLDDQVLDASALLGTAETLRDVRALLELPDRPFDRLRAALASGGAAPRLPLAEVRLRAPILQPPTVRDFFDFEAHANHWRRLRGEQLPEAWYRLPIFYFSNPLCIIGPDDEMPYPSASEQLDYELELAAVIGREGRDLSEGDALNYVAGFTILCDWSARDLQRDESQVGLGPAKGKDFCTSLGPLVVTTDEIAPHLRDGRLAVRCTLRVNGEQWMDGDGATMHHTWGQLVERASHDSRIVPGDVFGSGTVGGGTVGEAMHGAYPRARWLQPGDLVELEVEGIGILRNRIGPRRNPDPTYRYTAPPTT